MTYEIVSAVKTRDVKTQNGDFVEIMMTLKDDKGVNTAASMLQKPETPIPSGKIEGTIEQSNYGPKFKKDRTGMTGGGRFNDPLVRKEIIRQNALGNAIQYCIAKSGLMGDADAVEYFTGKHIIQVATLFAKYSEGVKTVVNTNEGDENKTDEITAPKSEKAVTANEDEAKQDTDEGAGEQNQREQDEINLEEIPF